MSVGTTNGLSKNVQTKPGEKILRGELTAGSTVTVDEKDDDFVFITE